jgi:hypothetical protein
VRTELQSSRCQLAVQLGNARLQVRTFDRQAEFAEPDIEELLVWQVLPVCWNNQSWLTLRRLGRRGQRGGAYSHCRLICATLSPFDSERTRGSGRTLSEGPGSGGLSRSLGGDRLLAFMVIRLGMIVAEFTWSDNPRGRGLCEEKL